MIVCSPSFKPNSCPRLLVTNPLNVTYLTGFSGEASYLVVTPKKTLLVSDGRFSDQLKEECPDLETVIRPPEADRSSRRLARCSKVSA